SRIATSQAARTHHGWRATPRAMGRKGSRATAVPAAARNPVAVASAGDAELDSSILAARQCVGASLPRIRPMIKRGDRPRSEHLTARPPGLGTSSDRIRAVSPAIVAMTGGEAERRRLMASDHSRTVGVWCALVLGIAASLGCQLARGDAQVCIKES